MYDPSVAKSLVKVYVEGSQLTISVLVDFFGEVVFGNNNKEDKHILDGIYSGLIHDKGVDYQLLYNAFLTNRLDELIHKKHTYAKTKYYKQFVEKQLKIGVTRLLPLAEPYYPIDDINKLQILTDDNCPSCKNIGYYTQNNRVNYDQNALDCLPRDCSVCYKIVCKICSSYHEDECSFICNQCDSKGMLKAIEKKISSYKWQDIKAGRPEGNLTVNDVKELLKKQRFKCYVCNDEVLTCNWRPLCTYQMSLDRIDETLPHNRDNVLISCYYCNCRLHYLFEQQNKNM